MCPVTSCPTPWDKAWVQHLSYRWSPMLTTGTYSTAALACGLWELDVQGLMRGNRDIETVHLGSYLGG
jgi:hypothetical protein